MNRFDFSAYRDPGTTESVVAALALGRCLARLFFHLQQGWILFKEQLCEPGSPHQRHFQRADQVYNAMASCCRSLAEVDADELFRVIVDAKETSEAEAFPDGCYETRKLMLEELREDNIGEVFGRIVDENIRPGHQRLRDAIRKRVRDNDLKLLSLGEAIEEGLCRNDIYRFLLPTGTWEILDDPNLPTAEEFAELDDYEVNTPTVREDLAISARLVSREPGNVAPHEMWAIQLASCWQDAALAPDEFAITKLRKAIARRKLTRQFLCEQIELLYRTATKRLTGTVSDERLTVTLDPSRIELDGVVYDVDRQVARIFFELQKAGGRRPLKKIIEEHPDDFTANRLDRIKMPAELRTCLKHKSGVSLYLSLPDR